MEHCSSASKLLPREQLDCQLMRPKGIPERHPDQRKLDSQEEEVSHLAAQLGQGNEASKALGAEGTVLAHPSDAWVVNHGDEELEERSEPIDWNPETARCGL